MGMRTISYRVLQSRLLSKAARQKVQQVVPTITCSVDAQKLAGKDGFSFRALDGSGRVGILMHSGAEVALLFQRLVNEVSGLEGDPIPEGVVSDPLDAWMMIDLSGPSAREHKKGGTAARILLLESENARLKMELEAARKTSERQSTSKIVDKAVSEALLRQAEEARNAMEVAVASARVEEQAKMDGKLKSQDSRSRGRILSELLPVVQVLQQAVTGAAADASLETITRLLLGVFQQLGGAVVSPMGEEFDPTIHTVVGKTKVQKARVGVVVGVVRPGIRVDGEVVLQPRVVVGAGAS